jgi:arylsulfatase A-like enzyme
MRFIRPLFLTVLLLATSAAHGARHPNVLLILTDDQGYGDISSHGNPHVSTPVLDQLAANGARFERFFVSPVCAPTRAALLTGRYALRTGVFGVTRGHETMAAEELTLAEALRGAGYRTGAFGKWHNGRHMPNHPNGQGFDEFFGFCGGHWQRYFDANLEHNGQPVESKGYIIDTLTDAAMRFIRDNREQPFLCYVPYNTPHSPWRVPEKWWARHADTKLDLKARCAYAMVENLDWNVGRLLRLLEELNLEKDTIVLFLTDNGANSDRFNAGMKGRKGSVDEGGSRVPLFIRWPGHIPGGSIVHEMAAHIDLLPTLLDLCDVRKPDGPPLDGVSLARRLLGGAKQQTDRLLFTDVFWGDVKSLRGAVRTERWRAVLNKQRWSLYDMPADPGQLHDLADRFPTELKRLRTAFERWFEQTGAAALKYHPAPVGHPARPRVTLPAHEAELHPGHGQGIAYTGSRNGFSNNWITDWTDPDAYALWELDILTPGAYRVELRHNLAPGDIGARVAVDFGPAGSVARTLEHSFHLPLVAKPNRVLPADGYEEKAAWKWIDLGAITLPRGHLEMRARALKIPGRASVELKAIRLTPINP